MGYSAYEIARVIKNEGINTDECIVVGSGILGAKGIKKINDIDLLVTEECFARMKKMNGWKENMVTYDRGTRMQLRKGNVEVFSSFAHNEAVGDFISHPSWTEKIEGYVYNSLLYLEIIKRAWGRKKDLEDLILIEEYNVKNRKIAEDTYISTSLGIPVSYSFNYANPLVGIVGIGKDLKVNSVTDILLHGVHAFCFHQGRLILVKHPRSSWLPPGGGIEIGEDPLHAIVREVAEETQMKVIGITFLGYSDIRESDKVVRQCRYMCVVEKDNGLLKNKEEEIQQMIEIDPSKVREYFNWGKIGDILMQRALDMYHLYQIMHKH